LDSAKGKDKKMNWNGRVLAVQPRIRLVRSFDERTHSYLGYVLRVSGVLDGQEREFLVGVGRAVYEKYWFRIGNEVSGEGEPVIESKKETAEIYKVKGFRVRRGEEVVLDVPPYIGVPPSLETYRERGHRRLDSKTYSNKCTTCIWGCEMAVEIIIDKWNPSYRYRRETFCYGPKNCRLYKGGPTRKVPGRKGMIHVEEDWVDEDAISHRGPDE
jgi:hypothetical protein